MTTERDLLPLHERQAARAAIEQLVRVHGSQNAASAALGISQNAVNKAVLYTRVGPTVMRILLEHLRLDLKGLLERYGDPTKIATPAEPAPLALQSPKEQAITTMLQFAPSADQAEVRAIADEYDTLLKDAPPIRWLDALVREVQVRILTPQREERATTRRQKNEQRQIRKLQEAAREAASAEPAAKRATR